MKPQPIDSIEQLFRENREDLIKYARRHWNLSHEDAEDIAHDALTQAWRKRAQFTDRGSGSHFGWVCQIMINKWKDMAKKKKFRMRAKAVSLDAETYDNRSKHTVVADPDSGARYDEVEIKIDRGFLYRNAKLSKREKDVLYLADAEGLKPAEIAHQLDLKPTVVHKSLNRARQKMREANPEYA